MLSAPFLLGAGAVCGLVSIWLARIDVADKADKRVQLIAYRSMAVILTGAGLFRLVLDLL